MNKMFFALTLLISHNAFAQDSVSPTGCALQKNQIEKLQSACDKAAQNIICKDQKKRKNPVLDCYCIDKENPLPTNITKEFQNSYIGFKKDIDNDFYYIQNFPRNIRTLIELAEVAKKIDPEGYSDNACLGMMEQSPKESAKGLDQLKALSENPENPFFAHAVSAFNGNIKVSQRIDEKSLEEIYNDMYQSLPELMVAKDPMIKLAEIKKNNKKSKYTVVKNNKKNKKMLAQETLQLLGNPELVKTIMTTLSRLADQNKNQMNVEIFKQGVSDAIFSYIRNACQDMFSLLKEASKDSVSSLGFYKKYEREGQNSNPRFFCREVQNQIKKNNETARKNFCDKDSCQVLDAFLAIKFLPESFFEIEKSLPKTQAKMGPEKPQTIYSVLRDRSYIDTPSVLIKSEANSLKSLSSGLDSLNENAHSDVQSLKSLSSGLDSLNNAQAKDVNELKEISSGLNSINTAQMRHETSSSLKSLSTGLDTLNANAKMDRPQDPNQLSAMQNLTPHISQPNYLSGVQTERLTTPSAPEVREQKENTVKPEEKKEVLTTTKIKKVQQETNEEESTEPEKKITKKIKKKKIKKEVEENLVEESQEDDGETISTSTQYMPTSTPTPKATPNFIPTWSEAKAQPARIPPEAAKKYIEAKNFEKEIVASAFDKDSGIIDTSPPATGIILNALKTGKIAGKSITQIALSDEIKDVKAIEKTSTYHGAVVIVEDKDKKERYICRAFVTDKEGAEKFLPVDAPPPPRNELGGYRCSTEKAEQPQEKKALQKEKKKEISEAEIKKAQKEMAQDERLYKAFVLDQIMKK